MERAEPQARPHRASRGETLRVWLGTPGTVVPAGVWLLSRVLFVLLTYFGVIIFNSVLHGPHPSFIHSFLPAWHNPISHGGWDTNWYLQIAERGYHWKNPAGTTPAAFFPLYPLLIHVGTAVTHRSALLVALLISNLAFLGALGYLYRLVDWELGSENASRTVLYIAIFPTALFFFAGYSESLFLLLTVACFYHMRRRDWLLAGLFAGLASATRVTGVLLLAPYLYEYARSCNFRPREMVRGIGLPGALLIPCGLGAFMLYLQHSVGDAIAFSHGQEAWQKILTLRLWAGFLETARQIFSVQPAASFYQAHNLINGGLGLAFLVASVLAARRLPASYSLYGAAFWIVTLASPAMAGGYPVPLISLSRYILSLFPVFMYLGMLGSRKSLHDGYLVLSCAMLSLFTIQFLIGGWIV